MTRKRTASFCAGAWDANLTCIIASRDAQLSRAGWEVWAIIATKGRQEIANMIAGKGLDLK